MSKVQKAVYGLAKVDMFLYKGYKKIKKLIFDLRLRMAVRRANRDSKLFGKRLIVIVFNGKLEVYEKQRLKELIRHKYFKKGTTIEQLEKMAYHVTK